MQFLIHCFTDFLPLRLTLPSMDCDVWYWIPFYLLSPVFVSMLAPNTLTIPSSTGCFSRAVPYRWGGRKNFALRCRPILRLGAALLHLHRIALPKQQNHKKDVKVFFHFAPFRTQPDGNTRGNRTLPAGWRSRCCKSSERVEKFKRIYHLQALYFVTLSTARGGARGPSPWLHSLRGHPKSADERISFASFDCHSRREVRTVVGQRIKTGRVVRSEGPSQPFLPQVFDGVARI